MVRSRAYYVPAQPGATAGIRIAPVPNVAFTVDYEYNDFEKVGSELQNKTTSLVTGGLRLAANANIQASLFYQYNSYTEQGRWNVRGSWQFAPLSFLYVVFNETSFTNSSIENQSLITKITYLKQF